jgi:transposase-like protein
MADFKAKVALEALRGELTTAQLATKRSIHPTVVGEWKRRRGSKQGNTRDAETLVWRGFGRIWCNLEIALFEPRRADARHQGRRGRRG